jgi:hypothetical protein
MRDRQRRESRTFEFAGAILGIGGLILLFAAIVIEIQWLAWTAGIVGAIGVISGLSLVAIGNLIRDWD